jgi:hypothetical protein
MHTSEMLGGSGKFWNISGEFLSAKNDSPTYDDNLRTTMFRVGWDGGVLVTRKNCPLLTWIVRLWHFPARAKMTDDIDAKQLVFPEL